MFSRPQSSKGPIANHPRRSRHIYVPPIDAIGEANGSLCVARLTTLLEPEHGRDVSLGRGTCLALDSRLLQLGPRCPCASLRRSSAKKKSVKRPPSTIFSIVGF